MPVVISVLNSLSGASGATSGFMLHNNLLITGGALVPTAPFPCFARFLSWCLRCKSCESDDWVWLTGRQKMALERGITLHCSSAHPQPRGAITGGTSPAVGAY
jgi:hypothetical protein